MNSNKQTVGENQVMSEWYHDLYQSVTVSRNRWFLVGILSLTLSAIEALALVFVTPLKSVEPYVLQVDPNSGLTSVLQPLKNEGEKSLTEEESLTKSFLVQYILARETYDPQDLNRNYDLVRLMSSGEESRQFDASLESSNPQSPLEKYKTHTTRTVRIRSVSFLDQKKKTAQVRFSTTETRQSQSKQEFWVAILTFRYVNAPMAEHDRLQNPLGFQVVSYRVDQEIVP